MTSGGDPASAERRASLYDRASRLARFGAWECDLATERLTWTAGVHAIFDYPTDLPLERRATLGFYLDESRRDMERMRAEAIRSGQGFVIDARIRTYRGEDRWMRLSVEAEIEGGRVVRIFGGKQDITADRAALERFKAMAERDALTGLPNRAVFDARYKAVVDDTLHHGFVSALLLIDLDRFKPINDRFGHLAGDACLCETAMRLRRVLGGVPGGASLIARIGGDEFAVLLPAPLGRARIGRILDRAAAELRRPFVWNGIRLDMACSIGVTLVSPLAGRRATALFAEADSALYAAKAAGPNSIAFFGEEATPLRDRLRAG
ncbi:GGDEF domain-containing protein [Enterovirga rhinocerotis]|uniref:Diguanylate cyclase (GGDEF)-like protein n=1 Tax=Enterovirga rhinocerotis TaxID=1339210 RepID=A0A4R7BPM9_9HYPH|nr:GGDEF domain-containing protein [Enterovirga rhinocerotis]TDR87331.1 diguanylate cyclase (GGDEF)-like protein [Enterovirga rhinocerotis]